MWRLGFILCGVALVAGFTLNQTTPGAMPKGPSTLGPKSKVFAALYERGPAYQKEKNIFQQPTIKEHIAHHEALGRKLIAAGPLRSRPEDMVVGIVIFEAESEEAAEQWLGKDPAVVGKVLSASVRQWGVSNIRGYRRE